MWNEKLKDRTFPFLRGYEELLFEHHLKFDVVKGKLAIVDLGYASQTKPETFIYLEKLTEMVEKDDIILESKEKTTQDKHKKRSI